MLLARTSGNAASTSGNAATDTKAAMPPHVQAAMPPNVQAAMPPNVPVAAPPPTNLGGIAATSAAARYRLWSAAMSFRGYERHGLSLLSRWFEPVEPEPAKIDLVRI